MAVTVTEPLGEMIATRLQSVRDRVASAGGDPERVAVVAVTKGFGVEVAEAAVLAGLTELGENYAAGLLAKADVLPGARWHFLGAIQRNKVRRLAPAVACWQSVDRGAAADAVARHSPSAAVFVQVNLVGDPTRPGCGEAHAPDLVERCRSLGLEVRGLMGVGPAGSAAASRECFRRLAGLGQRVEVAELSMGMSDDFEAAVAEGSTMIRVGRLLFGARPGSDPARR